jgi:hypothetical protein
MPLNLTGALHTKISLQSRKQKIPRPKRFSLLGKGRCERVGVIARLPSLHGTPSAH